MTDRKAAHRSPVSPPKLSATIKTPPSSPPAKIHQNKLRSPGASSRKFSKRSTASTTSSSRSRGAAFNTIKSATTTPAPVTEWSTSGKGTPGDPVRVTHADKPNESDCHFCPPHEACCCVKFSNILADVYNQLTRKRLTDPPRRELCAKSTLPPFVTRLVRDVLHITERDTFYDLGCGNGSVLFQVAYMTGARCVGVEINEHNAQVAREAWTQIQPFFVKEGRSIPEVKIITGNLLTEIAKPEFASPNTVAWSANLLLPKMVTHLMGLTFRQVLPPGARMACFDDLYPHSRPVARVRDPEIFNLFAMKDHVWTVGSVEWTDQYEGMFYSYERI